MGKYKTFEACSATCSKRFKARSLAEAKRYCHDAFVSGSRITLLDTAGDVVATFKTR